MVEIRDITTDEQPPAGADWVLIERTGERYVANGSAAGKREATFYTPAPFDALDTAIKASSTWAEINDVPVIYVRV
jgi:hypothetical protein